MKRMFAFAALCSLAVLCSLVVLGVATAQAQEQQPTNVAGTWNVTIHTTTEGTITEQWMLKQDGAEVTGTAKTKKGDMAIKAKMFGPVLRGLVASGTDDNQIHVSVHGKDFDGTIRVGRNVWLVMAKRAET